MYTPVVQRERFAVISSSVQSGYSFAKISRARSKLSIVSAILPALRTEIFLSAVVAASSGSVRFLEQFHRRRIARCCGFFPSRSMVRSFFPRTR